LPIHGATMTINGSLVVSVPIVKRFSAENFQSPDKIGPKMAVFRENGGVYINFYFRNPQTVHFCMGARLLTYFA